MYWLGMDFLVFKFNEFCVDFVMFVNMVYVYVFENNVSRVKEVRCWGGGCLLVGELIIVGIVLIVGMGLGESLVVLVSMSCYVR